MEEEPDVIPPPEPLSLVDLYDNLIELHEEINNSERDMDDMFSLEPEQRDTWDLMNSLVMHHIYHNIELIYNKRINSVITTCRLPLCRSQISMVKVIVTYPCRALPRCVSFSSLQRMNSVKITIHEEFTFCILVKS